MRIIKKIEKIEKSSQLKKGIIDFTNFRFIDTEEIIKLSEWLRSKILIHTLILQGCNICSTESVRSLFTEEGINAFNATTSTFIRQTIKTKEKTKADAIVSLINEKEWVEINISQNNLSIIESEKIIKAITSKQNTLRCLDLGYNALGENSVKLLAAFLKGNPRLNLKYLKLPRTFSRKYLSILLNALKDNTSIRELDLSNNDLIDSDLQEMVNLLKQNHTITEIKLTTDNFSPLILSQLHAALKENNLTRNRYHEELLRPEFLIAQVKQAIKNDDAATVRVIVGVPKKQIDEEQEFTQKQLDSLTKLQKLSFRYNLLHSEYQFLKTVQQPTNNEFKIIDEINQALLHVRTETITLQKGIINEYIERICQGRAIPYTQNEKKEIEKQLQEALFEANLKEEICLITEKTNFENLLIEYKEKCEKVATDVRLAKKEHINLQEDHCKYLEERNNLLELVKKIDLRRELMLELEEISTKFIEVHLDPNTRCDEKGNTLLLFSFLQNKPQCFKFLLTQGGNILLANNDNQSIFNELINNYDHSHCHQLARQHIKTLLNKWINGNQNLEKLKKITAILDNYLTIIIKNSQMSKIKQIVTGVSFQLKQRRKEFEKYCSFIHEISSHPSKENLTKILLQMLTLSQKSGRGLRDSSILHDNMENELIPFILELNPETMETEVNKLKLEFENQFEKYLQVLKEKKETENELNNYIKMFESLDKSSIYDFSDWSFNRNSNRNEPSGDDESQFDLFGFFQSGLSKKYNRLSLSFKSQQLQPEAKPTSENRLGKIFP